MTEQLVDSLESLTFHSFEAFCEDVASMFGNNAECSVESIGQGSLSDLKKNFKKLASVNQVQAKGVLEGTFQLLLDQAGLFVLAGVFVMLPEKRTLENIRNGTLKDADYINDAIKEVGNLLVGSWDRIFREEQDGHKHFKQTGTFVGSLWDKPEETIGLKTDQPCRYIICRMKIDDFPEFTCTAVFSEHLFETPSETTQTEVSDADNTEETNTQEDSSEAENMSVQNSESPASAKPAKQIPAETSPGPVSQAIQELTHQPCDQTVTPAIGNGLPQLTVQQIMNPAVLWADPEDTIESVLRQMQQHNVGYVLVGRDGQIEGLVSRSDIAAAISPYTRSVFAHWRRPLDDATLQIRIKWFMSRPVQTIRPEAAMIDVMETMLRRSVRGLPVVDAGGQLLGIVNVYDVFAALLTSAGISIAGQPQQAPSGVH